MKYRRRVLLAGTTALAALAALTQWRALAGVLPGAAGGTPAESNEPAAADEAAADEHFDVVHTQAQWRDLLTPAQFAVLREAATERPYSSPLNDEHRVGVFACAGCALQLFSSRTKFDSHTGWPSFYAPLDHAVATHTDHSFHMTRTEVHCSRCGGHLGHVFDDGPQPTGLRYCMNGLAMNFIPRST
ncbi:peptide-methionine (R)-S-oxide reductase MsrB [Paraburkholderia sp. SARCC-3016]|uniref:peptide-methionine (R)-S-oxide reductase MsrB n=1 Tax=Paraburkholderia sp. SARCC-3016 TaxID=3058611 RepID=UPI0028090EA1|nr:peptide-methionine (R)-S-oxide reductase MsrB [Paraburkholderia sp. SARCC-3016]MDQ7981972.1 peptide-methionine (R)-S-oxide reductase MsrB [Paraburkholderia sp. SARCC-3016]